MRGLSCGAWSRPGRDHSGRRHRRHSRVQRSRNGRGLVAMWHLVSSRPSRNCTCANWSVAEVAAVVVGSRGCHCNAGVEDDVRDP